MRQFMSWYRLGRKTTTKRAYGQYHPVNLIPVPQLQTHYLTAQYQLSLFILVVSAKPFNISYLFARFFISLAICSCSLVEAVARTDKTMWDVSCQNAWNSSRMIKSIMTNPCWLMPYPYYFTSNSAPRSLTLQSIMKQHSCSRIFDDFHKTFVLLFLIVLQPFASATNSE